MNKIIIKKPGLFTTIQDQGRWGFQQFGITTAGAMDNFSMRIANMLIGNKENEALLECTFLGPEVEFGCDEIISITGANMSPKINGEPALMWTSIRVNAGDKLTFSGVLNGLRTYIAFSKGIDVPKVMGSKSTYVRGNLGGLNGGKLSENDEIKLGEKSLSNEGSYLLKGFMPIYKKENVVRVVMGPQDDYFTDEAIQAFLNSIYKVTAESDRMGYRLDGPKIEHKLGADIISDGIVSGSVQVPGHGSPIIMMNDKQTTGGYTKIATVITPDLNLLAQMSPGCELRFEKVTVEKSHELYIEYENQFKEIREFIDKNRFQFHKTKNLNLNISERIFNVKVNEIE
ncbi:5-oxoprolinase subunit C family protein [Paratissierella segnis]|jgi:biotin-dependent carboxylase-like uncharacterized protein|uniref:Biotin-dependent carboxyltransferase family protein n=1 Tax=Paratissierella segnis TaxID=2763679 RepID=A0A926EZ59_9FIRM|nr:biotin-dependent carboxyltransferase family protein [Paratissierella segnis]MBC8588969.1 biotin-dependent carboxyltransferase family protein [Paratissierella segnis]